MSIFLAALMAGAVLPDIDRISIDLQAQAEALQTRPATPAKSKAGTAPARGVLTVKTSLRANDLSITTAICGAASKTPDAAGFLTMLGKAYTMTSGEVASLRETCAVYLAGQANARQASFSRASW